MERFEEIINKAELSHDEKTLLADTINYGEWGNCDMEFNENGAIVTDYAIGFITNEAYQGCHFERKKIPSMFKKLYEKLPKSNFNHCSDWWGDGSGDVFFVRKLSDDFMKSVYDWAKSQTSNKKKKFEVKLFYHTSLTLEVYAENEDEARDEAYEMAEDDKYAEGLLANLQPEGTEVHEIDVPQKKAYLVSFAPMCRVVVDGDADNDEIIKRAAMKMLDNPEDYIYYNNVDEVKEDTECPYDPEVE